MQAGQEASNGPPKRGTRPSAKESALAAIAFTISLSSSAYSGPLPEEFYSLIVAVLLGLAASVQPGRGWPRRVFVSLLLVVIATSRSHTERTLLSSLLFVYSDSTISRRIGLCLGAACLTLLCFQKMPWLSMLGTGTAMARILGFGQDARIGPTPCHLWHLLAFCVFLLPVAGKARRRGSAIGWILLFAGAWAGSRYLEAFYEGELGDHAGHGHPLAPFRSSPLILAVGAATVWALWRNSQWIIGKETGRLAVAGGVLGIAASVLTLTGLPRQLLPGSKTIHVYNHGGFDWEVPNLGKFGGFSSGMFGLLPYYLAHSGFTVNLIGSEELVGLRDSSTGVLVLMNCNRTFAEQEKSAIRSFVQRGGTLLVLADHTDVFGQQRAMNPLLEEYGIKLNFDSAYHEGGSWNNRLAYIPGVLGHDLSPLAFGIAIGCSLDTKYPAEDLLYGTRGFSDAGMRANTVGAFLGNYEYDVGEQLGDVVVAALATSGRGCVVVLGDTSGFQNLSLQESVAHFSKVLSSLGTPDPFQLPVLFREFLILGCLAILVSGAFARRGISAQRGLLLGMVVGLMVERMLPNAKRLTGGGGVDYAVIDYSHAPDVGFYDAGWNPIGGIAQQMARGGMLTFAMNEWDSELVRGARCLFLVDTQRSFCSAELMVMTKFVQEGGLVVLALGGDQEDLQEWSGVTVSGVSMGSLPKEGAPLQPRFVEAHPVVGPPEAKSLYRYGDLELVLAITEGAGKIVVLGDPRFFAAKNVEGVWGTWAGNVQFIREILAEGNCLQAPLAPPYEAPTNTTPGEP